MKKQIIRNRAGLSAAAFFSLLLFLNPTRTWAAGRARVTDEAQLLDSGEEAEIQEKAQSMANEWGYDFLVYTTEDAGGKSSGTCAEDYYLDNASQDNGIVYIIDMDNREVNLRTSGAMIDVLSDARIDRILDDAYEYVSDGEYADTFLVMLDDTQTYLEKPGDGSHGPGLLSIALIAAALGMAGGIIFFFSVMARYRMKTGTYRYDYRENGALKLNVQKDRLINRFVTHRHIERKPPEGHSGGGGSTHVGSGGHTFGGGKGRSF